MSWAVLTERLRLDPRRKKKKDVVKLNKQTAH